MSTISKRLSFIVLCSVTMIAFQNCGETSFSSMGGSSEKVTSTPDPEDDGTTVNDDNGSMDPVKEDEAENLCAAFRADVDFVNPDVAQLNVSTVTNSTNTRGNLEFVANDVTIMNHRGRATVTNSTTMQSVNTRGRMFVRTRTSAGIVNSRGSLCLVANSNKTAEMSDGKIAQITNHRGRLEIDGLDVDSISNVRGTIIIRNSNIGSIDNARGNIKFINSTHGDITNQRGSITEQ